MLIEQLWLKISKIKWPTLVIGSEDYNFRRKAFFMGCFTMINVIQKTPDSALIQLMTQVHNELKAELQRGDAQLIINSKLN